MINDININNKAEIVLLFIGQTALLPPEQHGKKNFVFHFELLCNITYNLISLFFSPSDIRIPLMWKGSDHFNNKESM